MNFIEGWPVNTAGPLTSQLGNAPSSPMGIVRQPNSEDISGRFGATAMTGRTHRTKRIPLFALVMFDWNTESIPIIKHDHTVAGIMAERKVAQAN